MNKPDYKKLYDLVSARFDKTRLFHSGPLDETFYTLRVFETAKRIISLLPAAQRRKVDRDLVLVATIVHDIGKCSLDESRLAWRHGLAEGRRRQMEWKKHPALGVMPARRLLLNEGYAPAFVQKACFLVANHANRKMPVREKTLELKIVQDADWIADAGMAGFIRPLLFAGQYGRKTIESLHYLMNTPNRIEQSHQLNLTVSIRLAARTLKEEKALIAMGAKCIDSELLAMRWDRGKRSR